MNILVVCHYGLYRDFTSSFVHNQGKAIAALGHRVRVIVPIAVGKQDWNGKRFSAPLQWRKVDGVELCLLRHFSLSNFGKRRWNLSNALIAVRSQIDKITKDFSPDIIHAHTLGFDSEIGAWLKNRLHAPLVVTTHGSDTFKPFANGRRPALKQFAQQSDHLICVSTLLKKRIETCGTTVPISVILNGFQVQNITLNPNKLPLSLVQVGHLTAQKKVDITIQAFAKLSQKYQNATLDIIGSGGKQVRFQTLCKELGISKTVHFYGLLPNAETLSKMASAHFFVMPSVNEGFGIVYLEAMASGCITIGTEGEGIADVITSGVNGFLVPPDNPKAIVRIIEWCLDHPKEAAAIAKQGQADAMELTWEKNASEYTHLFERIVLQWKLDCNKN